MMGEKMSRTKKETVERPPLKKRGIKMLDLAFAVDCTASMDSYIESARDNIRIIVEEIEASEGSNVHLALVEYRDHPPQDRTFVTRVHDFMASPKTMKEWLSDSRADGGGDTPEAVADALHDVLKLSWREDATKICVCISDAAPHGINAGGDGFPNGCPCGIDPIDVTNRMAEKGITLYMVGCEPSITPYREFFVAIAFITGGQYVPLNKAQFLTQVVVGGAQEEMSLEQFMDDVNAEAQAELTAGREINEEEFTRKVHSKMRSKGIITKQLHGNKTELSSVTESPGAKKLANCKTLSDVRKIFKPVCEGICYGAPASLPPMYMEYGVDSPVATASIGYGESPPVAMSNNVYGGEPPVAMEMAASYPIPVLDSADSFYQTVEADISYDQTSRMVQKCLKRNMIKK